MSERRLTDEQIANLEILGLRPDDAYIESLIDEVKQARQRRCDGCAHWEATYDPTQGDCARVDFQTSADWFCADYTPR
jgi:hypothetical protein